MRTELPGSRPATGVCAPVRRVLSTGLALTVPLLVTLFVLGFTLGLLVGALDPLVLALEGTFGLTGSVSRLALHVFAVGAPVGITVLVGVVAKSQYGSGRIEPRVEALSSTIAFLTAEPGKVVRNATSHQEMVPLFLPMVPNSLIDGFVIHVAADRVYDVAMTAEEGVQAIVASGVAVDEHADGTDTRRASGPGNLGVDERSQHHGAAGNTDTDTDTDGQPGPGGRL